MQIKPRPNKAHTREELKYYLLAHCDEDIRLSFAPHGFLLEPLLLQLVREFHLLRMGESERADYAQRIEDAFRALAHLDQQPGGAESSAQSEGSGNPGVEGESPTGAGESDPRDDPQWP
jgi:hypothetical protein